MQDAPEDFDAYVRDHTHEPPPLPSGFQERVWQSIRIREHEAHPPGWLECTFFAANSTLRVALSFSITAILISSLLGIWLGNSTLAKPEGGLFPTLTSAPELFAH
jgi:hypothetical protein